MVSVILRTKDRPLLLRRALGSVLEQTLDSWRVLLVDDGATPDTVDGVLADLRLTDDPRIQVIRGDQPFGRPGALNAGLAAVVTPLWTIHDDDDRWAPTFLAETSARLEDDPAYGAVAVRTAVVRESVSGDAIAETDREILAADVHHVTLAELLKGNKFPPISILWRSSATGELGGFADDLTVLEDWEFTLRLAERHPIDFIDGDPLAFWHQRPDDTGSSANSVVAEADAHTAYDAVVRDRFLRRDASGIGTSLATAALFEESRRRDEVARSEQARVIDQWGHALTNHLSAVADLLNGSMTELHIEVARLRGELKNLRAEVATRDEALQAALARLEASAKDPDSRGRRRGR